MIRLKQISFFCIFVAICYAETLTRPEQVHLALTEDGLSMVVTWVTLQPTNFSMVEFGLKSYNMSSVVHGVQTVFTDGGDEKRRIFMHRATMDKLQHAAKYFYHVGSPVEGWSDVFWFNAPKAGSNWSPRFIVFGDMGNVNAQSLTRLQEETMKEQFDVVLHAGDFAYNMDDDNARVADAFMNQIQSVAGYVPYMTCVGNHENAYNFSNYKSRFSMPEAGGDGENLFFSFNVGPVHVVSFSSEVYFYTEYGGVDLIAKQYEWLENDLKEANKHRGERPWLITMCHRPLYCSNSDHDDCTTPDSILRVGLRGTHAYGIEELLYKYGVDVHITAHEHSYERLYPVYNNTLCKGQTADTHLYVEPDGPVNVVTGSAGCQEGFDPFKPDPLQPWSAFHIDDYGYTRLSVHNQTHLSWEQVSDDQDGKIIDFVTIIKKKHGAGLYNCH